MIIKRADNYKTHRLREISLYEVDYSLILALYWRNKLYHAENKNLLNIGTFESWPNYLATTPPFMKELILETTYLTHKHLIMFNNDGTLCYNWILVWIMLRINRCYGPHNNSIIACVKILKKFRSHLKANKNTSEEFYQHWSSQLIHRSIRGVTNSLLR